MAAFKKGFLVLAVVLLALAGASGTAYAQLPHPVGGLVTCTANSAPTIVRAEGIAEILGDIVLQCIVSSNISLPASILTNFAVTLNTNVTNNRDFGPPNGNSGDLPAPVARSSVTDAVLLVNEAISCISGPPFVFGPRIDPTATPNYCNIAAPVIGGGVLPVPGQTPQYGILRGNNTLAWDGVAVTTPCGGALGACPGGTFIPSFTVTTIRMTNIRGNASIFASGDLSFPSAQLTAVVSVTGTTNLTVSSNVLNVGSPLTGLVLRFRGRAQRSDVPFPVSLQQCLSSCIDSDGNFVGACLPNTINDDGTGAFTPNDDFLNVTTVSVRLSEGFATAFKTLGFPTDFPGLTQVEDGFRTPGSGINNGGANQGTRFIFKFFNVPAGVRVFTPLSVHGTFSTIGGAAHTLSITKLLESDVTGSGSGGLVPGFGGLAGRSREVAISGGSGFTVYEVVDDNPFAVEALVVPVVFADRADTANDRPAVGQVSMSVNFAPLSTVTVSDRDAPEPRFVEKNTPRVAAGVVRCITNILFPFVVNQAGFDTGFSIANTSCDDKGTVNQSGTCTLFPFGETSGGGAAPSQQTTSVVPCGKVITWLLSSGNSAVNITGMPGFKGYLFARCEFQFAHGFAFITDGFGGTPAIAEGYLALVVKWDGVANDRGFINGAITGESLGH